jgi:site-specific recombinase XerD
VEGLDVHLAQFLAALAAAGYAAKTQHDKRRAIVPFIRWTQDAQLAAADLDEARVDAFLARPSRRRWKCREPERAAVRSFLEHLRAVGAAPPLRSSEPAPSEALVRRYLGHLRCDRGLCARSVDVYSPFVRAFVAVQRLPEHLASLDASDIRAYLLDRSMDRSTSFVRLLTAALRSFLRFLFLDGGSAIDLSTAVPPVRRWSLAGVPPFLTPEEVELVIEVADRSTARGRRAFAILLLLAGAGGRSAPRDHRRCVNRAALRPDHSSQDEWSASRTWQLQLEPPKPLASACMRRQSLSLRRPAPLAREAVERQVDDGCGEEGEQLRHEQPAHDGDAERTAQLGAGAGA